jgi:hypothetical protein
MHHELCPTQDSVDAPCASCALIDKVLDDAARRAQTEMQTWPWVYDRDGNRIWDVREVTGIRLVMEAIRTNRTTPRRTNREHEARYISEDVFVCVVCRTPWPCLTISKGH